MGTSNWHGRAGYPGQRGSPLDLSEPFIGWVTLGTLADFPDPWFYCLGRDDTDLGCVKKCMKAEGL